MLSNLLGLTIDKGDLNKTSPTPVVNTLKKTATNYLAIGKMAEDLKVIKLNFSRYLASQGVKVRGTPDMHFLKDDERAKKFNVLREKYTQSKLSKGEGGGSGLGSILTGLVGYKFRRTIERKVTAAVLKRYRKMTAIRQLVRFKRKLMSGLNKLLAKINIKKIFSEWFSKNSSKILKPLIGMFSNAIKRFVKKGLTKLIQRATVSVLASIWSGPVIPFVAGAIFVGLTLWEPIKEAWEAYTKGEDFIDVFIVSVIDSFTFGIFGEENIKTLKDSIAEWIETMSKKVSEAMNSATEFVKNKMTEFTDFIIEKAKSVFTMQSTPENFKSSFEELNSKRMKEESEMVEKYGKYFDEMGELIEKTKIRIAQYRVEIAVLKNEIKGLTEGPEKTRLDEVEVEKAKEEQKLVEQEVELTRTREGGTTPVVSKPVPAPKPAPAVVSAPPAAVSAPPASKPSVAAQPTPSTKPTQAEPSDIMGRAVKAASEFQKLGLTNKFAQEAILKVAAKESGISSESLEAGAATWIKTITGDKKFTYASKKGLTGYQYMREVFPQLKTMNSGKYLKDEELKKALESGNDFFFDMAYGYLNPNFKKQGLGNDKPGDGYRYRGRGFIQITGKAMYEKVGKAIKQDLIGNPDLITKDSSIASSAALAYLAFSFGKGNMEKGIQVMNSFKDSKTALDYIALNVAFGGAGMNEAKLKQAKMTANFQQQLAKAEEKGGKVATSAVQTASGGKFLQDESKQVAQAQREQLKPKDVDVVKVASVNNVKQTKNQNVASSEKVNSLEIVTNRAV